MLRTDAGIDGEEVSDCEAIVADSLDESLDGHDESILGDDSGLDEIDVLLQSFADQECEVAEERLEIEDVSVPQVDKSGGDDSSGMIQEAVAEVIALEEQVQPTDPADMLPPPIACVRSAMDAPDDDHRSVANTHGERQNSTWMFLEAELHTTGKASSQQLVLICHSRYTQSTGQTCGILSKLAGIGNICGQQASSLEQKQLAIACNEDCQKRGAPEFHWCTRALGYGVRARASYNCLHEPKQCFQMKRSKHSVVLGANIMNRRCCVFTQVHGCGALAEDMAFY
eukprot:6107962-Amphidinium_carterae.1